MKIDLVMWTYNSERTLDRCLGSISRAIPEEKVCHKIAVDGGSTDQTSEILENHGWQMRQPSRRGIPYQANYALQLVDTKRFAAFEHDIVLNQDWFERTSRIICKDVTIGAVQGIRLYTGSHTMQAIDEWMYRTKRIPAWSFSIDNTLFHTEAVRLAGGFSNECMASADNILRRNLFRLGRKWITDNSLISGHYRRNFFEQFRHQLKSLELARYYWSGSIDEGRGAKRAISLLGGNPAHALRMTLENRMLRLPLAWYLLRFQRSIYLSLPHGDKRVRSVAMDDYYLARFMHLVMDSARNGVAHNSLDDPYFASHPRCLWCGNDARTSYLIPRDWINIRTMLGTRIHNTFYACSRSHTIMITEKIFKTAFDYVYPGALS